MTQTQRSINYELAERAGERGARTEPEWYSVELAKRWKQKQSRQTEGRGAARRKKCEVTSSCVWVDVSERQSGSERKVALGQEGFTLFFKHIELFVEKKNTADKIPILMIFLSSLSGTVYNYCTILI